MTNFLPKEYEAPKSQSRYLKFKNGSNVFRILDKALLGWLDWTEDKKPVRTPYQGEGSKPKAINPKRPVKHFWAFPVWDYSDGSIKILEITQSTIQNAIYTLHLDEAWGSPLGYDIDVKKSGEDLDTKYDVVPKPSKELTEEIKKVVNSTKININALMKNEDPFSSDGVKVEEEEISLDNIPF